MHRSLLLFEVILSYLLLFVSLTFCPGVRILPFFSQMRWGSGTPWATQVNTALLPAGLETDCGHCTNSGGASQKSKKPTVRLFSGSQTYYRRQNKGLVKMLEALFLVGNVFFFPAVQLGCIFRNVLVLANYCIQLLQSQSEYRS